MALRMGPPLVYMGREQWALQVKELRLLFWGGGKGKHQGLSRTTLVWRDHT